jgi:hypothetical protein
MQTLPLKRAPQTKATQREAWMEKFRQSGLSRQAFARRHGLKLSTFHRWLAQAKMSSAPVPQPAVFKELNPQPVLNIHPHGWEMEILTPAGLLIRLR